MTSSKKKSLRKRRRRQYELTQSPFYRLERLKDLAKLLGLSRPKLSALVQKRAELYVFRDEATNGKIRALSIPRSGMRRVHVRLFRLLSRIKLPDHIRSPRKKSTSWGNALIHADSDSISTFDIKDFYPSTTEEHVFRFFKYKLEMSDDAARVLALICTINGRLPLGSPMSPHLACLTHLDLFSDAAEIAASSGHRLSVWVDDITVSGPSDRRDIRSSIRLRAEGRGLLIHKYARSTRTRGTVVTGSFIKNRMLAAANSTHLKIKELHEQIKAEMNALDKHKLMTRLVAQYFYLKKLAEESGQPTGKYASRIAHLRRRMRVLDASLRVTAPPKSDLPATLVPTGDSEVPWQA